MGDDAQQAAPLFLLPQHLPDARIGLGDVFLHVGEPVILLVAHLGVRHAHLVPEEGHHAGIEVPEEIVLQRAGIVGEMLARVLHKAGEMHRGGAVDDGVIVIHDQAGVSHGRLLRIDPIEELDKGSEKSCLAWKIVQGVTRGLNSWK